MYIRENCFEQHAMELVSNNANEKRCASIKIKVLKRLLAVLRENGFVNRTNLAGKAGLNYHNCIRYLNLLQLLGWVEMIDENCNFVTITEKGVDVFEKLVTF